MITCYLGNTTVEKYEQDVFVGYVMKWVREEGRVEFLMAV